MGKMVFITLHYGDNKDLVINVDKIVAIGGIAGDSALIYTSANEEPFYVLESVQEVMQLIMNLKEYFN